MAQFKFYGHREVLENQRKALSDATHACATEAFGLPQEKRFHRFEGLDAENFIYPAGRTEKYTIIEVLLFEGRPVEAKKKFYALMFDRFEKELGIGPNDLEITLIETPRHDWAIRGLPGDELELNYKVG